MTLRNRHEIPFNSVEQPMSGECCCLQTDADESLCGIKDQYFNAVQKIKGQSVGMGLCRFVCCSISFIYFAVCLLTRNCKRACRSICSSVSMHFSVHKLLDFS